ncbi:hypothetical protein [Streptomyces sp. NPDC020983]|uniref:hypothetical protein n=1 Tax=Streptomyces sp. NPDC020983 TaxID=3365106 RepID=UPI0037A8D63C
MVQAAIEDDAKTRRLQAVIEVTKQADIEIIRAETERHKDLLKSQTEQLNSRFRTKVIWGVGGLVVLVAAAWAFSVPRAVKAMHLPLPSGVAAGAGTIALGATAAAAAFVGRKIRAWIARRAVSEPTGRAASAPADTVTRLPTGPQAQPPQEQGSGQSQADVS